MSAAPRFQAEYIIRENLKELETYSSVFHNRIAHAFEDLQEEADQVQSNEYARLCVRPTGPDDDPSWLAEMAYEKGVAFYLATDAIRQGVVNLMVAGLFHLFEQQAAKMKRELPAPKNPSQGQSTVDHQQQIVMEIGVDVTSFKCWSKLEELRLVANATKHGDGISADKLKARNPSLFEERYHQDCWPSHTPPPIRPLVGEGLRLTEDQFVDYAESLKEFWKQLADSLALKLGKP